MWQHRAKKTAPDRPGLAKINYLTLIEFPKKTGKKKKKSVGGGGFINAMLTLHCLHLNLKQICIYCSNKVTPGSPPILLQFVEDGISMFAFHRLPFPFTRILSFNLMNFGFIGKGQLPGSSRSCRAWSWSSKLWWGRDKPSPFNFLLCPLQVFWVGASPPRCTLTPHTVPCRGRHDELYICKTGSHPKTPISHKRRDEHLMECYLDQHHIPISKHLKHKRTVFLSWQQQDMSNSHPLISDLIWLGYCTGPPNSNLFGEK